MKNEEEDPKTINLSKDNEEVDFNRLSSENQTHQKIKFSKNAIYFLGIALFFITTIIIIIIVIVSLNKNEEMDPNKTTGEIICRYNIQNISQKANRIKVKLVNLLQKINFNRLKLF